MNNISTLKKLPPRAKSLIPVATALLSIVPVVPIVDHAFETVMEPTLGAYLGLQFHHANHSETKAVEQHEKDE